MTGGHRVGASPAAARGASDAALWGSVRACWPAWVLIVAGCGRAAPPPTPSHGTGLTSLFEAVARGDAPAARQWAELDVEVDVIEDGGAAEALGAARGYLRLADGVDELADGATALAAACGRCHLAAAVPAPSAPEPTHAELAAWVAYPLVWGTPPPPLPGDAPPEVTAAWEAGGAAVALATCAPCHAAAP